MYLCSVLNQVPIYSLKNLNTMAKVSKVSMPEMEEILKSFSPAPNMGSFARVTQFTRPVCTKKDRQTGEPNPFADVAKMTILGVNLNVPYEVRVQGQLRKEDKESTEYKKGVNTMPIEYCDNNNFFGYFKGEPVLVYLPHVNANPRTKFVADGIMKTRIEQDILPKSYPAKNQGTDQEVIIRKVYLKNVRRLVLFGQHYKIVQ